MVPQGFVQSSDDPQTFLKYFEYFDSIGEYEEPDYDAIYDIFASKLTVEELKDRKLFNISDYYYEDNIEISSVVQNTPFHSGSHSGSHSLLSEEDLRDVVIDERFLVGELLGRGASGFVRSGRLLISFYFAIFPTKESIKSEWCEYDQN